MSAGTDRIITSIIVTFVLLTTAPAFAGKIIYVDDDGPADFNNIQAAINDSNDGDTIIVAEGRYFENINFNGSNITLTSTVPNDPNVVAATIIDGNNNGSVVTFDSSEDANCVLNGFTITNGSAERGGGIYCSEPPGPPPLPPGSPPLPPPSEPYSTSPTIKNCIISNNNSSSAGGGMFIAGGWTSQCSPTLTNCTFNGNSTIWGGGMYNNCMSNPTLTNCEFSNNSAGYGGGMFHEGHYWASKISPTLTNCTFSGNKAYHEGGGMLNIENGPTLTNCAFNGNSAGFWGGGMCNIYSSPTLTNCTFNKNSANYGGGMSNFGSSPTLKSCTFSENLAVDGGGMFNRESSPKLTNCTFNENPSQHSGGGMFNSDSIPTLVNCTFKENSAKWEGGGIYISGFHFGERNPILTNCIFNKNSAGTAGGGLFNNDSSPIVANCIFNGNSVVATGQYYGYGGGMTNYDSSPIVDNCIFTGNSAGYYNGRGGGMYNIYSNPMVSNCTLSGNMAGSAYPKGGGGIYNEGGSGPMLTNCILWGNMDRERVDELAQIYGGTPFVGYTCIQGLDIHEGNGNIGKDPCFIQPGYWEPNCIPQYYCTFDWIEGDYHLLPSSPCINTGDPNYIAEIKEKDLDGKPRVIGCRIDMGAFEYRHLVPAEVRFVPRTINLANREKWITAYLWFPEEYSVSEIDFCTPLLEDEIEPEQFWFNEQKQIVVAGFNLEQHQEILDTGDIELTFTAQLTDATCFEGTDVIKVIYEGGGKLARFGKASNPNPANGTTGVDRSADLSWTAGFGATSHDVYFGTANPPPFIGNQTAATFDPGKMASGTKYFWRIDEISKWGQTTGDLWSFTTYGWPGPGPGPPPPPPPPT